MPSDFDSIVGGDGFNTLSYEAFAGIPININLETLFIDNIQRVLAPAFNDNTLTGSNTNNSWTIDGNLGTNSGTLNGTVFKNFNNLIGGTGDDNFSFVDGGAIIGQLQGGSGSNTLDYTLYGSPVEIDLAAQVATGISASYSEIDSITGSTNNSDILRGASSSEIFETDGNGSGRVVDLTTFSIIDFTSIERLDGRGGDNSLEGLAGANNWVINGANSGLLNGNTFENFSSITGSDGPDVFAFEGAGAIAGHLQGSNGIDELSYSNYNSPAIINLDSAETTGTGSFATIEVITGSAYADTLVGSAADETFRITGTQEGSVSGSSYGDILFSALEIINGGLGDNRFILDGITSASGVTIEGGSDLPNGQSNNLLRSRGGNTTWQLNGKNRGVLRERNISLVEFEEIQNLENRSAAATEHTVRFDRATAQITGSINSGSSDLVLVGNEISIGESDSAGNSQNGIISGSGRLTIRPASDNIGISLGGVEALGPAVLDVTAGEIAAIQGGFIDITIGGETHTGGISLGGDVAFKNAVRLRSQGDIDTRGGELRVNRGRLSLETEGTIFSDRLISQTRSVTLNADGDITTETITARGEQGIDITSNNNSITVNGTLDTGGGSYGDNVVLNANTDVRVGDIVTTGSTRSGNVTIRAVQGGITTGGITTANNLVGNEISQESTGSVALESPGSIKIEFIDARGNDLNTNASGISITTDGDFEATGTINSPELSNAITGANLSGGASISTVGANTGNVQIEYGRSDLAAMRFVVGTDGTNGSALRIETPQTAILSGDFLGSYTQKNINLVNRGILPPVVDSHELLTVVSSINFAGADVVPAFIDFVSVVDHDVDDVFTQIETQNGQAFSKYLGIENAPAVTLQTAQKALREIEQATDTEPAVLYVYFVPDATSTLAVSSSQSDENKSPDDQLEILLMTGQGEPIRRRQWGVTRAQVEEANQELRHQATSQFSTTQQYLSPAQQLHDWIIRPVTEILKQQNITSLGFVMDSSLRTMPIAALHDGESFLLEQYSLGVLPSFSLANIHNSASANRVDYSQERVLAMGASEFDNQPNLPAVSAEIELISQGLGAGDAFLNEEFVLETLQTQLSQEDYGIVHLATHAVFEPGDLERSYIQLWNEQLSLSQLGDLQLSEEDIRLMILSACSTALGDRASEYGFAGLAVSAGSQAALASIWPVSDEGTLGFMAQFYEELRGTSVLTEALRQTQLQMMRGEVGINDGVVRGPNGKTLAELPALAESGRWDFSHPFYWSPFTMIGNPW